MNIPRHKRRDVLKHFALGIGAMGLGPLLRAGAATADPGPRMADGRRLPPIGMGTWISFNVGADPVLRGARVEVLRAFFELGGGMVDCSPMYGSSAEVLGHALQRLGVPDTLFSAEKVWTRNASEAGEQIEAQRTAWRVPAFDLMQVHNLMAWEAHLDTLAQLKADGALRYVGITTSHGRRHRELERVLETRELDFVQLTYNITHREVERRLLPIAHERGIAVIANRPYDGGALIRALKRSHPVPAWAREAIGCQTWADYLLRFVVSHPAVACAIPATSQVAHMRENMGAGVGPMPDPEQRARMVREVEAI
ncbi:MAG: aldo/keto reductase [Pseudomonadota bacterium]